MTMKILQAVNSFKYAWSAGGAARVAYDLSIALARKGYKITVFTTDKGLDAPFKISKNKPILLDGIETYYFRNLSTSLAKRGFSTPYYAPFIIRKKLMESDVIHIHEIRRIINAPLYHFAKKYKIPYVLQAHGSVFLRSNFLKQKLGRIFDLLITFKLLRGASKLIALTKTEAGQYRAMGVPEEKIAIIPNGIDLSEYAELPSEGAFKKKFNIPEGREIILYLGRIHKTKGIDFLVRAYAHLINEMNFRDAVLVIAGPDDGYLNEAKALANFLGVYNSTIFTGFISSEDKLGALVDADVFVTPSFYGFPITFLEACAVGTPIITTSLGDTLEWIDENVGYVTQPTPYDLAEAMYRIISDDLLCRNFSRNCIKIARSNFSIEKVVEKLEKVYEEIVRR